MRLVIQRVKQSHVSVNEKVCGKIDHGLLVFLGIHKQDTSDQIDWLVKKLVGLRIFCDPEGKMNLDIRQVGGDILVISQFTLYGSLLSGRRPEFTQAALPQQANLLYEKFVSALNKSLGRTVQTGIFGTKMEVSLINDGPVTFLLER